MSQSKRSARHPRWQLRSASTRSRLLLGVALAMFAPTSAVAQSASDSRADPDARAKAALGKMSLDEKIQLLHGPMPKMLRLDKRPTDVAIGAGVIYGIPRLGIPAQAETDASLGVANLNETRKDDGATALASGLSLASTWDPAMARAAGTMIGGEARAKGFNVMLAGGVNLVRDPRAGRNFEYLGEDPLLAGTLVGEQIAGIQSNNIISTIKHFAINNIETRRNSHNVEMDERSMRESDLLAFEIGIERGKPHSVMCSYNRLNGVYACENSYLLNDVLRRDWGFKGYVLSDWGAVHSTESIKAGLDQQSGEQLDGRYWLGSLLRKAVDEGRIDASVVDTAAGRILRSLYASGVADHPVVATGQPIDVKANSEVSLRAAEAGIVLLRNEGGILPLVAKAKKIAVIGGHADVGVLSGGGSTQVSPVGGFALEEKGGTGAASFAKRSYGASSPLAALKAARPDATFTFNDGTDLAAAAAAARQADVVIVFGEKWSTEAADQLDLSLDRKGDMLIDAVARANPQTVVVLETGNPVAMPWRDKVKGIVAAWFPGQRGGEAIANVLVGNFNPSGHLPVTFPAAEDQLPNAKIPGVVEVAAAAQDGVYGLSSPKGPPMVVRFPEGSDVGYRWYDAKRFKPLYAFGHGLSYTSFRYDGLTATGGTDLTVRFKVTNTGSRAGADVPQVYIVRPGRARRLIGWGKPDLAPGTSQEVVVHADPRIIGDYDVARHQWVVPAGTYRVEVSRSATEPVLKANVKLSARTLKP